MGWLLGVYYALRNKSVKNLFLSELAVAAGHISSVALTLGPLYYLFTNYMISSWIIGLLLLAYATFRILKRKRHPFLGLRFDLKKLSAASFLLALQHAGTLSLIPVFCISPTLNLQKLGLLEMVTMHSLGVIAGIYSASAFTYVLGVGVLRRMWINFEMLWIVVLLVIGLSILLVPLLM